VIAIGRAVPAVTVGFSLAKGERTDWAVAKLTELGIDRIAPLVCDRTVSRSDSVAALATRAGRFGRIAREASMQARRPWRPQVDAPQLLSELLAELLTTAADRPPVPEPGSAGGPAAARTPSAVGIALAEPGGGAPSLAMPVLLIGPEGGWSPAELAMGFPTVSLGNTILRVETAAVVAGALLTGLRSRLVAPVGFATEN
jgi:16S rRNA (uracil1498-N3)-methyltransferase